MDAVSLGTTDSITKNIHEFSTEHLLMDNAVKNHGFGTAAVSGCILDFFS
jgi:hypothetical protein